MPDKQNQIEKLLVERYGFIFKGKVNGALGARTIFNHLYGFEASVSQYRVCFYSSSAAIGAAVNSFPAKNSPRCFDVDKKGEIKSFLEKFAASRAQAI